MLDSIGTEPVRLASLHDEGALLAIARELHDEAGLRAADDAPFPFSEERARATLHKALVPRRNDPFGGDAWIGVVGEAEVEGAVYLTVDSPWTSEQGFLLELWSHVLLDYRDGDNAKRLLAFSKRMARQMGLRLVTGVMSTTRQPAKQRFYEKSLGCRPLGSFYVY